MDKMEKKNRMRLETFFLKQAYRSLHALMQQAFSAIHPGRATSKTGARLHTSPRRSWARRQATTGIGPDGSNPIFSQPNPPGEQDRDDWLRNLPPNGRSELSVTAEAPAPFTRAELREH
jgi:hypothetical protein